MDFVIVIRLLCGSALLAIGLAAPAAGAVLLGIVVIAAALERYAMEKVIAELKRRQGLS